MSCFQTLKLDSNTGDLAITEGNTVNLVEVIKKFSIKTPVLDFKINGNYLELYYKNEQGLTVLKKILLPTNGGNGGSISVANTQAITAVIQNNVITTSLKLSIQAGNKATIINDGLYVGGVETNLVATDSSTINFTATGPTGHNLTGSVLISATAGNAVVVNNDGLFVPATPLNPSLLRSYFSGTAPITYNNTTGVIGIIQSDTSTDGYISAVDWNSFNSRVITGVALGTGINPFKQKISNTLEYRAIKAGLGIGAVLSGDDIIINTTSIPPTVTAGSNQTILSSLATVNFAGAVVPNSGTVVSATWFFLTGPSVPTISDTGITNPVVTGLNQAGTYKFRLLGINSVGLSNTGDINITVTTGPSISDTIYYGAHVSSTPPNAGEVSGSANFTQNGALDVPIDWTSFSPSGPLYCWAAIPDGGSSYLKHKWVVIAGINEGNIGSPTDLFGAPTQVTISGVVFNVYFTNYATQFTGVCTLKNA